MSKYLTTDEFNELNHWLKKVDEAFGSEEALKAVSEAKKIAPEDFDVIRAEALAKYKATYDPADRCRFYKEAREKADEVIRRDSEEYESIHDWYRNIQGRPYMRLLSNYADALVEAGRLKDAKGVYEDILSLTHYDGIGNRYRLMGIYALFEDGVKAERLLRKYKDCEGLGLFLPASVCFFKKGDIEKAEQYLAEAFGFNENLPEMLRKSSNKNFWPKAYDIYQRGYRNGYEAWSYDECVFHMMENKFLYDSAPGYFTWARHVLEKARARR